MHSWHWQTWNGLPYLTCSVLDAFPHGFFTQQFAPRTPADLVDVIHPAASVHRVWQVHGNTVLTPTDIARSQATPPTPDDASSDAPDFPPADGLVTEQHAQAVWVCTADCVPVLIADVKTGQVAAVHAGWRGTAAEIVPQAIARLQEQGSQLSHLRVALGPAIAGEVYQVEATVAAQVGATVIKDAIAPSDTAVDQVLQVLQELPDSPILADGEPGKARLDVRRVNVLQLERLGLTPEQVAIAPYCTYQHIDHFFSYRRSREKKVQWSGIVSTSVSVSG